jgi:uncharacterized protein (TIGR01777 family)
MKILVTGATGLVGEKLCFQLYESGHDLVVIGRSDETQFRERFSLPCGYLRWQDLDSNQGRKAIEGVEVVYHLAGESIAGGRWTSEKMKRIRNSRVLNTEKLMVALSNLVKKPELLVGASAVGFYGDRGPEQLDEQSSRGEGFLADVCDEWENAYNVEDSGIRTILYRIGVVLSQRGGFLSTLEPVFENALGGVVGTGQQYLSWIHENDLISLLLKPLQDQVMEGVYNACAPNPVTNQEFTADFASALSMPAAFPLPSFMAKTVLGKMSELVLGSQRVVSSRLNVEDFKFQSMEEALEDLYGYRESRWDRVYTTQTYLPSTLEEVFDFFSSEKNLEKITPPWLEFRVVGKSTPDIQEGTEIDYRLKLKGIPFGWKTLIKDWNPPEMFSDTQLKGPYNKWYHIHEFRECRGGVLMTDRVTFRLPLGLLGSAFGGGMVRKDVNMIFSYRTKAIQKEFMDQ